MAGGKRNRFPVLAGQVFGRLTTISEAQSRGGCSRWNCACECGKSVTVLSASLKGGDTTSCGCRKNELARARFRIHGMTNSPEHVAWRGMLHRCTNPNYKQFADYGGRGVRVCDRWMHSFENFLADVGKRPSTNHSLDRYPDTNGHYEPGNVRWATRTEQNRNRRYNHLITYNGESLPVSVWSERLGFRRTVISDRLALGWTVEAAMTTPVRPRSR